MYSTSISCKYEKYSACLNSTYLIHLLTSWSRVLLEKRTGSQLVNKSPPSPFYGTRKIITALTRARHLSLSWASSIQSMPPYATSWRSSLILSFHLRLGLPSGLFPSGFTTKTLYTARNFKLNSTKFTAQYDNTDDNMITDHTIMIACL